MEQHVQRQAPLPGTWLQVSRLDEMIRHALAIGDKLYLHVISSNGHFGCYVPKLRKGFWIDPANVEVVTDLTITHALEQEIPAIYRIH